MIITNTIDMRKDFKSLCLKAEQGEMVLITGPMQKNLILISEEEFTKLEHTQKAEPQTQNKFEILSSFFGIAKGDLLNGKSDKEVLAEGLVGKYVGARIARP
ncbi:MAG: hypothetical protein FWH20_04595 [Oscillospiraceae bacterium]|nr:hypothetical protein [Oscillospiraceae bacterium]